MSGDPSPPWSFVVELDIEVAVDFGDDNELDTVEFDVWVVLLDDNVDLVLLADELLDRVLDDGVDNDVKVDDVKVDDVK